IAMLGPGAAAHLAGWRHGGATDAELLIAGDIFDAAELPELDAARVMREPIRPDADAVARLALTDWQRGLRPDAASARPLYVRDNVAFTIRERAKGAGGNHRAGEPA